MLSDRSIRHELLNGCELVSGLENPDVQIGPSSVDLRLGNEFKWYDRPQQGSMVFIRPKDETTYPPLRERLVGDDEEFVLWPGMFVLAVTKERIALPKHVGALVHGRSSLGRLGLFVHNAGYCDPGWRGYLVLELFNASPSALRLKPGMRICQIEFNYLTTPADSPYGTGAHVKYQDQRGAQESLLHQDRQADQVFEATAPEPAYLRLLRERVYAGLGVTTEDLEGPNLGGPPLHLNDLDGDYELPALPVDAPEADFRHHCAAPAEPRLTPERRRELLNDIRDLNAIRRIDESIKNW